MLWNMCTEELLAVPPVQVSRLSQGIGIFLIVLIASSRRNPRRRVRAQTGTVDGQCQCNTSCGPKCENRCSQVECDTANSRNGDNCGNRASQATWEVDAFDTANCDRGLRPLQHIPKGAIILEWKVKLVTGKQLQDAEANGSFMMEVEYGTYVDAAPDSLANYVNHLCEPNCGIVKREVTGSPRVYVQSKTAIGKGV